MVRRRSHLVLLQGSKGQIAEGRGRKGRDNKMQREGHLEREFWPSVGSVCCLCGGLRVEGRLRGVSCSQIFLCLPLTSLPGLTHLFMTALSSCLPQQLHPSAFTQQVLNSDAATPICHPVIGCPEGSAVSLDSAHSCCTVHLRFPKPEKRKVRNSISLYASHAGIQPPTFEGSPIGHCEH